MLKHDVMTTLNKHQKVYRGLWRLVVVRHWQLKPEVSWVQLPAFSLSSLFAS